MAQRPAPGIHPLLAVALLIAICLLFGFVLWLAIRQYAEPNGPPALVTATLAVVTVTPQSTPPVAAPVTPTATSGATQAPERLPTAAATATATLTPVATPTATTGPPSPTAALQRG